MKKNAYSLAQRYAKAFDSLAKDDKDASARLEQYRLALESLKEAAVYIDNPTLPAAVKQEILAKALPSNSASSFISLLVQAKRFDIREVILQELQTLLDKRQGIKRVMVTTAKPLPQSDNLIQALGAYFNGKVEVDFKEDSSLLAGIIVKQGDLQIDGSAAGRIERLQKILTER